MSSACFIVVGLCLHWEQCHHPNMLVSLSVWLSITVSITPSIPLSPAVRCHLQWMSGVDLLLSPGQPSFTSEKLGTHLCGAYHLLQLECVASY